MEGIAIDTIEEELKTNGLATLAYAGFDIEAEQGEGGLRIRTSVFHGGNYIPPSVRRCLGGRASMIAKDSRSEIHLWIDQEKFRVVFDYRVLKLDLSLASIFEEFLGVAEEWRALLDEYGQQDLIHVPVK